MRLLKHELIHRVLISSLLLGLSVFASASDESYEDMSALIAEASEELDIAAAALPTASVAQENTAAVRTGMATIYGKPYYPSDYTPEMTVYARSLSSGKTYSVNVPDSALQYKIKLPAPDNYVLFSWTKDRLGNNIGDPEGLYRKVGALYSHCSATVLDVTCDNHSPEPVALKPNQVIRDFQISDYYYDKDQVPQP